MNADALSDLVLLLACAGTAVAWGAGRPAWRGAMVLLGLAAAAGVLRYSGVPEAQGPHRFLSLLAACVAFVLMLADLRWPDAPLAQRGAAVGRFVVLVGGLGVAVAHMLTPLWAQVVPGFSALLIVATVLQRRSAAGGVGAALLLGSFVVAAVVGAEALLPGGFSKTQALHYLLAGAVVALAWAGRRTGAGAGAVGA